MHQSHKDLFSTLLNQLWRLVSGPITMLLIPVFLSPEQQGYWFLFGSISALSIFADLGFSNIILQFSAHEFAFLQFTEKNILTGDETHLKRLGSFFRFTIKWLSTICVFIFPIIYVVGVFFFIRDGVLGIYILPWTIFSIGSLINFFNNSILSFIEGMNKITAVQKIRLRVAVLNTCIVAIVLVLNGNIYALSIAMLVSSSTIFVSIFGTFKKILGQLLKVSKNFANNWRKEILPLFTKYIISTICVYFTLYIYIPIMHLFHGPIYAGRAGLTLALVNAIFGISNIWIYTIIPQINILVEKRKWTELDKLVNKRLFFSVLTYVFFVIILCVSYNLSHTFKITIITKIFDRSFSLCGVLLLCLAYFWNIFINTWGVYLAAHKELPYLKLNIFSSLAILISVVLIAIFFIPELFFLGTCLVYSLGFFIAHYIFKRCKVKWHEQNKTINLYTDV